MLQLLMLFFNIALQALRVHRRACDVTAHVCPAAVEAGAAAAGRHCIDASRLTCAVLHHQTLAVAYEYRLSEMLSHNCPDLLY